jgi:hypothetical protein
MPFTHLRIAFRGLIVATTACGCMAAAEAIPPEAAVEIWTVPAAQKVFRDDERPDGADGEVRLAAAGGETESAQVVLRAGREACILADAVLSGFHDDRGVACPDIHADILQVAYVYLPERNRAWPDPLPPFRGPLPLQPGLAQPLWLSVRVPPTAPAGTYRATLRLSFDAQPAREVPVSLRVFGFRLPEHPAMRTAIGNQMDFVLRQHGVQPGTPEAADLRRNYYQFFLERRLSPYELPCDLFSPEAARWLDDPRLTSFVIPSSEDDAELRRLVEHLRAHDWLKKGFFYVWDEPQTEDDFEQLARRARRIREIEPQTAIMVPFNGNPQQATGRSTYDRLDGLVDQWCPLSSVVDVDEQKARAARGEGSWWYVCCAPQQPRANVMVDWPGAAHRALFWQQKQRGIDGFLYWSATYWNPTYTRDPWTSIHTYTFKGDCYGDGSLVYPGDRVGIAGPVSSIRLELLRDGMDDFEYLTLFEKLRGQEAMQALTRRATTSLNDYTSDPLVLDGLRLEMAEALEQAARPQAAPAPTGQTQTRSLDTADVVGLANDRVSVAFDRGTGRLRSLRNLEVDDELLKHPVTAGNPFRVHVDPTEVPSAVRLAFPWPIQPPDDALGGEVVDPGGCRLATSRFARGPDEGRLTLELVDAAHGLGFDLRVTLPDGDSALDLELTIRNTGTAPTSVMAAIPHLTGLGLGPDPAANLGVRLRDVGQSRAPAWSLQGGVYTRDWSMPWNAVYDPATNATLGMIALDESIRNKILRRWQGGGMEIFYFDTIRLAPGESAVYPTSRLLVARGDWKVTARRYREWFAARFPLRHAPAWFAEIGSYSGAWMPSPKDVAAAQARRASDTPLTAAETGGPITSFADLPRAYLGGRFDLQEWAQYWQGVVTTGHVDAFDHCDGIYEFRGDLGGAAAMRRGVAGVERIGRHVGLYIGAKTVRLDSDFLRGRDPRTAMVMETPDATLRPDAKSIWMCLSDEAWQDHLARTCGRLLRESGAKYIRLDELGELFETCHNPAHHHASPYDLVPCKLELLRKVRAAMDAVDPDSMLFTEGGVDVMNLHTNGMLGIWNPGADIAPLRLAVPSYQGLAYHYGQVDSALQGFACAGSSACTRQGFVTEHHESIWGVGLERKPACYPPQADEWTWPPAADLQWDLLRVTFQEAMLACDPTDENPSVPALDARDRDDWAGRLWRSPRYWLLTCGSRAAVAPAQALRVRLPDLPTDVVRGLEIDTETLRTRPVAIERTADGTFVETVFGFSAVLLPRPNCPPLVLADATSLACAAGRSVEIGLASWPPPDAAAAPRVSIEIPGVPVTPARSVLPATAVIRPAKGTAAGHYILRVTGDCLPLKRWLTVMPDPLP